MNVHDALPKSTPSGTRKLRVVPINSIEDDIAINGTYILIDLAVLENDIRLVSVHSAGFLAPLPEELILQILTYAGEVVPDELAIRHPAGGLDPLFTDGKLAPKSVWEDKWKEAVATRLSMVKVCRKFRRITTPILYSSFFTTEGADLRRFLAVIQRRPELGQHIRRIDVLFSRHQYEPSSATNISEFVQLCPNLQILSTPMPLDPSILPTSLKSLQIKYFLDHPYKMDLAQLLHRLEHLERLSLRMNLSLQDGQSLAVAHHPSLRTICFEGSTPGAVIENIISAGSSIQSIRFGKVEQDPAMIFKTILSRTKHLTHLSFPLSWIDSIPPDVLIPTLRHVHLESPATIRDAKLNRLHRLGPIKSMGRTLKDGLLFSTMEWLKSLVTEIEIHRMSTGLTHVYTERKTLRKMSSYDDPSRVREWIEQEELGMGSGIEWFVQSGAEIVAVQNILREIESDPLIEEEICCWVGLFD
jgi:hypothetical protein